MAQRVNRNYVFSLLDMLVIRLCHERLVSHLFHGITRETTRMSSTISYQQELLRYAQVTLAVADPGGPRGPWPPRPCENKS